MINRDIKNRKHTDFKNLDWYQKVKVLAPESKQAKIALLSGLLLIVIATFFSNSSQTVKTTAKPFKSSIEIPLDISSQHFEIDSKSVVRANVDQAPQVAQKAKITVAKGDSLSLLFKRAGLKASELHNIMQLGKPTEALKNIFPGDIIYYQKDSTGALEELQYPLNEIETLIVTKTDTSYAVKTETKNLDIRHVYGSAAIKSSLYAAGKEAGLSDRLVVELSNIFQWDIDFILDIRVGDRFSVLYEEKIIDGNKAGVGKIVAASFTNQGKTFTAVRYQDRKGNYSYYTPSGKSMRKAFLRAPLSFSRVSGNFNLRRKHPILNRIRAHRGVDYAAAHGTPVRASGDGKVKFAGRKGGFGKLLVLTHGQSYQSKYAHLSRFAKGIRSGSRVKQGQIIGYVGATGLATGPHLHYEFLVNGVHRNPRTVALPNAKPINNNELALFKTKTESLLNHLQVKDRIYLAQLSIEE